MHGGVFVEVDVLDDKLDGAAEFIAVAEDGQGVQGVDEGEGVVAKDVVDVDVGPARQNIKNWTSQTHDGDELFRNANSFSSDITCIVTLWWNRKVPFQCFLLQKLSPLENAPGNIQQSLASQTDINTFIFLG